MKRHIAWMAGLVLSVALGAQTAPVEVSFWHAMGGKLGEKVQAMADQFNAGQNRFKVVPVYKGSYAETMTAGIAAFRAGTAPAIMQVFEVGTATMMGAGGAIKPVYQLMEENKVAFDPAAYLPAVTGYYTDSKGKMLSFPFNSSTPVLYYNKDAFRKTGLDPEKPPRTWKEMEACGRKLVAAGYKAAYTSTWMSWIHLENFSAWHDVPSGTLGNGIDGIRTELQLDTPLHRRHLAMLNDWQKDNLFVYGGRTSQAGALFANGDAAMITDSSAGYASYKANAKFDFGVTMMPYHDDVKGAPRNSIIGGASLWVFQKQKPEVYRGVAEFFAFLSRPEIQADWHQSTGYLPITTAAFDLTRSQGFYDKMPGTDVAIREITLNKPTVNSRGVRYGNMVQIRDIVDGELEALFAGKQTPEQALKAIVDKGNQELRKFERTAR